MVKKIFALFLLLVFVTFSRWLPESELRKMLENVAALNRQNAEANTPKVGFSGTWTLDKSNSEGLPPNIS